MVLNFILSSFTFLIRGVHFINWKVFNHLILILGVVNYWTDRTPLHYFHYLLDGCRPSIEIKNVLVGPFGDGIDEDHS